MRALRTVVHAGILVTLAATARAQPPAQPPAQPQAQTPVLDSTKSDSREGTNQQKDWHFIGHVEFDQKDTTIFADDAWFYQDGNKFIATGNVVFAQGDNRISAERIEFDTETRLGTFFNASGISTVKPPRQPIRPGGGIAPPQMAGQETVVYFFGETIEKLGPKKYKITNGGFSTCVQPTPRWDLVADTVTLNVDHYTFLRQAVLRVKGVPMLYLPVLYYPTKREDRATGLLIPTYGSSSYRGQSIHNAFFWAMNRSQDATFFHDWYSKTGQGEGSEYRYNFGGGDDGNIKAYVLNNHDTTVPDASGVDKPVPGSRSFEIRGGANQLFPGHLRARGSVNYFSSIETSQTLNTNIYDLSRSQRDFGGNIVGAWGTYTLNSTIRHSEYFYSTTSSTTSGDWPRISVTRNERPLLNTPLYFSASSEYAHLVRSSDNNTVHSDSSLTRVDFNPQIRYPFKKWQWFTINTTASWHETYYTRSLTPKSGVAQTITDEPLNRPVFALQANMLGPLFSRIWDTPENGYAEKFKHAIEPFLNVQKTFDVPNFERVVVLDGLDYYLGGATYTYGVNNRFYAKRKPAPGALAQAREIVSVELSQSYYSTAQQSLYDRQYQSNNIPGSTETPPSHFSAVALSARAMPTNEINATVRAEFDSRYHSLKTISASGGYSWTNRVQSTVGWSKRGYIPQLAGFNDKAFLDQAINTQTSAHTLDNRFGGIYGFNYDVLHSTLLQQRVSGFYNAQCCGLAFEYQIVNFGSLSAIPSDHRFFMSFTLAGLGNFSPFNGALGGVPR
jgi:LPS-assembly protein